MSVLSVLDVQEPRVLCLLLGCSAASLCLLSRWLARRRVQNKIEFARERREAALSRMEKTQARLSEQHPVTDPSAILSLSLLELTEKLRGGVLSPEMVLHTYMAKALEVTQELNCITDFLPECELQLQRLREQTSRGPLYGVPISLKDNHNYKGHDTTLGLIRNLELPASEDCVIVQVLKKQGAVPFVKTNIPQSMLNYDCSNPMYGQTLNPLNHRKTPGGSSGGEGALISAQGSILGFGSDIGGSIRFPCAFCGVCGFKPTGNRLSKIGLISSCPGQKSVMAMIGPISRDVDSLVTTMRAVLCDDMFRLDPTVPPIPFNDELVPFKPPRVESSLFGLAMRGLLADGGSTFLENFKGDRVDENLRTQVTTYSCPSWLKSLLSVLVRPLFPRLSLVLQNTQGMSSVKELWRHHVEVEVYRQEFITQWRAHGLDVLICPILGPALTIGYPGKLSSAVSYTILYNLVDFPAGVLPVTTVTHEDEEALKMYEGHHKDFWDKLLKEAMTDSVGLPVAIQCVALPWQEEQCLRLMKEVEKVTKVETQP
ncbi:fatty-acid amide hydrolase 1-like isoform X2 [Dendrobates tinctorius]|uniref:fatty-acid amide hydrolase 1-like isoform X2 n=1 Tax=Dendrobates tinctorius TaxID=92724 RepID=UPI003CCA2A37